MVATMFTFGYWGWGSSTKLLLEATAAADRSRGFAPPMFVDLRVSRSVRASEFNGSAFQRLAGADRYRWMPELGNQRVRDRTTGAPKIVEPAAAEDLLSLVLERAKQKQRVLAFCACAYPRTVGQVCHRTVVADLVLKAAKRGRTRLMVEEWPGGDPSRVHVTVSSAELRRLAPSTHASLAPSWPLVNLATFAWGSLVTATDGEAEVTFLAEAAKPSRGRLVIPQMAWGWDDWRAARKEIADPLCQRELRHFPSSLFLLMTEGEKVNLA
jgi:hypothetical protein